MISSCLVRCMKWRALFAVQHGRQGARLPLTLLITHATIIPAHILWGVLGHVHTPDCGAFRDNAQRPNGRNALHSTPSFRRRSCVSSECTPPGRASWFFAPAFLILRIQTTNHKPQTTNHKPQTTNTEKPHMQ